MVRKRSRRKNHLTWSEKVPERSGKTNARKDVCASSPMHCSYGGPGAGVEAAGRLCPCRKGQGSQADLSLPPRCDGVSYSKA